MKILGLYYLSLKGLIIGLAILLTNLSTANLNAQCTNPKPIGASTQTFCKTDNKLVSDLVVSGGTIVWYNSATGGSLVNPSTLLSNGVTYYADDIQGGGCSVSRLAVSVVINGLVPKNVDVFVGKCAGNNPTIADLSATGFNIEWFDAQFNGNFLPSSTPLEDGKTYWVQQTVNGCISNRLPTTVTIFSIQSPTVEPIQYFCGPPNPTVADLYAVEDNVLWYDSIDSFIPLNPDTILHNGQEYYAAISTFPCESDVRSLTTVVIDAKTNPGTNGFYTGCAKDFVNINLFDYLGGNPDKTGYWTGPSELVNGYLGSFSCMDHQEGVYTYNVPSEYGVCPIATSTVTLTFYKTDPPTSNSLEQTFCSSNNPTLNDIEITGNQIKWYDSETATTPLDSTTPLLNGQAYYATQTDASTNCESKNRLAILITIVDPSTPTTNDTNQEFCEIDSPTISSLQINETNVVWYASFTDTVPLNSTEPLINGEDYYAALKDETTGCESVVRLQIIATIHSTPPPTTSEITQTFCDITSPSLANLTITGQNIIWYASETDTTPLNQSTMLVTGQSYYATQTIDGCESKNRLKIDVVINSFPSPTTSNQSQTFCLINYIPNGPTIADIEISGSNILWYNSITSTTPLNNTDYLLDSSTYYAAQTDPITGCESKERLPVSITISNPNVPTALNPNQSFCEIDSPTISSLQVNETNVVWYATQTDTTPLNPSEAIVDNEDYWAALVDPSSGCESTTRLQITTTIISTYAPTTTSANQVFCAVDNPTLNNLDITGTNIKWYTNLTNLTALSNTTLLVNGTSYYATQTVNGCESKERLKIDVTVNSYPAPTTTSTNQTFCLLTYATSTPTIADISITGTAILWYSSSTSTVPLNITDNLVNNTTYYATQTDPVTGCESKNRLAIKVNLSNPEPPVVTEPNQTFCQSENPKLLNLQISGTLITWYETEFSTTPLSNSTPLITNTEYWASNSSYAGCENPTRVKIFVTVNDVNPPTVDSENQTFCWSENPTIANLQVTGNNVYWFSSQTTKTPLDSTEPISNGSTYWAAELDETTGCFSSVRVAVFVTVSDPGPPILKTGGNELCFIDKPTLADLTENLSFAEGSTIEWYSAFPSGILLSNSTLLEEGGTYFALEIDQNGCAGSKALEVTVTLEVCDYEVEIYDGFSPNNDGINDTFVIKYLGDFYPNYKVEFFNRWGNKIYETYKNKPDWNGRLNGTGELLPAGVYFFIIYYNDAILKPTQHRLYLSR